MLLNGPDTLTPFVKAIEAYGELPPDSQVGMFTAFVVFNYVLIIKLSTVPWLGVMAMTCSLISLLVLNNTYKQSLDYAYALEFKHK